MNDDREEYRLLMEEVAPVLALEHSIRTHTALQPTALMLPLSLFPDVEMLANLPVVRGDRTALIYEPVKR